MPKMTHKGGWSKRLSDQKIAGIRAATGRQVDIAVMFGVTQAQVSRIKNEKRRKNVPSNP